jgi:hypothetical protein
MISPHQETDVVYDLELRAINFNEVLIAFLLEPAVDNRSAALMSGM